MFCMVFAEASSSGFKHFDTVYDLAVLNSRILGVRGTKLLKKRGDRFLSSHLVVIGDSKH